MIDWALANKRVESPLQILLLVNPVVDTCELVCLLPHLCVSPVSPPWRCVWVCGRLPRPDPAGGGPEVGQQPLRVSVREEMGGFAVGWCWCWSKAAGKEAEAGSLPSSLRLGGWLAGRQAGGQTRAAWGNPKEREKRRKHSCAGSKRERRKHREEASFSTVATTAAMQRWRRESCQ